MWKEDRPWQPVLEDWFAEGLKTGWPTEAVRQRWFQGGARVDAELRQRFGDLVEAALDRELVAWEATAEGRLALVLLLDQFPRNLHRGTARAFAGDHRALTLVQEGMARGMDEFLTAIGRVFFWMPMMHAEDLAVQERAVRCYEALVDRVPAERRQDFEGFAAYARLHRDIIARFGRFPHRNEALERASTAEEQAYLETADRFGQ